jgi:hypothetical protein
MLLPISLNQNQNVLLKLILYFLVAVVAVVEFIFAENKKMNETTWEGVWTPNDTSSKIAKK